MPPHPVGNGLCAVPRLRAKVKRQGGRSPQNDPFANPDAYPLRSTSRSKASGIVSEKIVPPERRDSLESSKTVSNFGRSSGSEGCERSHTACSLRFSFRKQAAQQTELLNHEIDEIIDKTGKFETSPVSVPKRKAPTNPNR